MNTTDLTLEHRGRVATLCMSRADGLNLLGSEFLTELLSALRGLRDDPGVRVVVITGRKHFCAGADIKEMADMTPVQARAFAELGHSVCNAIEDMPKPVIAAVSGYALGGGCELALACDLRIAAEDSRLGLPELNLGLIPGFGGTQRLAKLVGQARARELIYTSSPVTAAEAHSMGLVNRALPLSELIEGVRELAEAIAAKSPLALASSKRLTSRAHELAEGLDREISAFAECFSSEDHREGVRAFIEKRRPDFRGR